MGYLDGTTPSPSPTIAVGTGSTPNHEFVHWKRQDQLILHALLSSLTEPVIPLIGMATTSHEAWSRLHRIFSKRSQTHIIHLKDKLSSVTRGSLPVSEFLLNIKTLADELSTIGAHQVMLIC